MIKIYSHVTPEERLKNPLLDNIYIVGFTVQMDSRNPRAYHQRVSFQVIWPVPVCRVIWTVPCFRRSCHFVSAGLDGDVWRGLGLGDFDRSDAAGAFEGVTPFFVGTCVVGGLGDFDRGDAAGAFGDAAPFFAGACFAGGLGDFDGGDAAGAFGGATPFSVPVLGRHSYLSLALWAWEIR
jgi:hypothetical protein